MPGCPAIQVFRTNQIVAAHSIFVTSVIPNKFSFSTSISQEPREQAFYRSR